MSEKPTYGDFAEYGLALLFFAPCLLLICIVAAPFAIFGRVLHRWLPMDTEETSYE